MVQLNQTCLGIYHRLIGNKKIKGWDNGEIKDCLIQHRSSGDYAVMPQWTGAQAEDSFYGIFTEKQLHESFTEQFTNLPGFSSEHSRLTTTQ